MSQQHPSPPSPIRFLFENSLFLVAGAVAALVWANLDEAGYRHFVNFDLYGLVVDAEAPEPLPTEPATESGAHAAPTAAAPLALRPVLADAGETLEAEGSASEAHEHGHGFTVHFLINDLLMAFFFAIAGKEVWESLLPGGALSNLRKAATPLMATLGGIIGPAGVYLAGALLIGQSGWFGQAGELGRGWAIPCATDIAFSYLVARLVFGPGHPAIAFLLLLAIADDAAGLLILAVFYPSKPIEPMWLLLTVVAIVVAILLRRMRFQSFWWYVLIPGTLSWVSFYLAGVHPALGLVPIIPTMPHANTDLGIYAREELDREDTLNEFEHWWKNPVELILGLFGLVNAGVVIGSLQPGTWLVLGGLLVGKPVGISLFTLLSEKALGLQVPAGMTYRHVVSLGIIAAIGFTVALFVSTAAYPPGATQDAVKMGALLSIMAAVVGFVAARLLGVRAEGHAAAGLAKAKPDAAA